MSSPEDFGLTQQEMDTIKAKFASVKALGYVRTHRGGPTGIGKTLEDLLGIRENNLRSTDILKTELKAARKRSKSMLTIVTQTPQPDGAAMALLDKYGYPSAKDGSPILHCTMDGCRFVGLKGTPFCKLVFGEINGVKGLAFVHAKDGAVAYYTDSLMRTMFREKYPHGRLFYVKADSRGSGTAEEFHFNEAYLYAGFNYDNFIRLCTDGTIKVDLRMGQYPDGRLHDHGTGFRIEPPNMYKVFPHKMTLL